MCHIADRGMLEDPDMMFEDPDMMLADPDIMLEPCCCTPPWGLNPVKERPVPAAAPSGAGG